MLYTIQVLILIIINSCLLYFGARDALDAWDFLSIPGKLSIGTMWFFVCTITIISLIDLLK
jgi:hypothetical protein